MLKALGSPPLAVLGSVGHSSSACLSAIGGGGAVTCTGAAAAWLLPAAALAAHDEAVDSVRTGCAWSRGGSQYAQHAGQDLLTQLCCQAAVELPGDPQPAHALRAVRG